MAEKRLRLKLFDYNRDGKGVSKNSQDSKFGLKRFFITYKDNINKILYTNILMVLGNFPFLFLIAALSGYSQSTAFLPSHDLFQNLAHIFLSEDQSAYTMALYALEGLQNTVLVPTTLTYVLYGLSAIALFTFGIVNVGTAYILRNIAMGEPVFVWSDFWYAIKRNWRQALPFGIIDIFINGILIFNIYNMLTTGSGSWLESTFMWSNIVIFILYFFMRYYIYVQMVTFKLSVFKIIKNSLIFALLGFKRNILALLGILLCLVLEVSLIFGFGGILISFAVAAPLTLLFSSFSYMKVYAAFAKIKEIMIDPYAQDGGSNDEDTVMRDDVTEAERLAEVKRRNGLE